MAKANIESKNGTKITIDGTPEEISKIIEDIKRKEEQKLARESIQKYKEKNISATDFILQLREQGFFDKARTLVEIKNKLAENGLIYPITSLSPILLIQVRKRNLGRIKEGKIWGYVKRR